MKNYILLATIMGTSAVCAQPNYVIDYTALEKALFEVYINSLIAKKTDDKIAQLENEIGKLHEQLEIKETVETMQNALQECMHNQQCVSLFFQEMVRLNVENEKLKRLTAVCSCSCPEQAHGVCVTVQESRD